jgi:hypothetical protein
VAGLSIQTICAKIKVGRPPYPAGRGPPPLKLAGAKEYFGWAFGFVRGKGLMTITCNPTFMCSCGFLLLQLIPSSILEFLKHACTQLGLGIELTMEYQNQMERKQLVDMSFWLPGAYAFFV